MIAVRRAKECDVNAMGRIYVEAWQDAYAGLLSDDGLVSMTPARHAAYWAKTIKQQSPKDACLVATLTGHGVIGPGIIGPGIIGPGIIGMASAGPTRTRDLPFGAEVFTLYVDPNHQRQGAGLELLGCLFSAMRQAGQRSVVIWALDGNPVRTFYERFGGVEVARRTRTTFGEKHEEIAFGWPDLVLTNKVWAEGG